MLIRNLLLFSLLVSPAAAHEELTVVSWDGAYVKSQMLGFILPYENHSGIDVEVVHYSGGIEEIRRQVRAWNVRWDVVDLEFFDAIRACEEGLLMEIDPQSLPPAADGTPAREDFLPGSLMTCGVGNVIGSTVVAYDRERLAEPPQHIGDFFDLRKFPGRRGLRKSPQGNLEWALIADGVERKQVYQVLDTEEGVARAFAVLDRIKPYIEWWQAGEEAIHLLESGQVTMSSSYSGRVYEAAARGESLAVLWDHQIWFVDVWGILKHSQNAERALDFIRFATSTHSLARQAGYIPYGPVRKSSMQFVGEAMSAALPTNESNQKTAIPLDAHWWSKNQERLDERFQRWLKRPVMVPRRLPR